MFLLLPFVRANGIGIAHTAFYVLSSVTYILFSFVTGSPLLQHLEHLFQHYGYGVIGVIVMLESMGIPLPAETLVISAAIYCATTHRLDIAWVATAAIIGAITGDNLGYLIGRGLGYPLLERHGAKVGLTSQRLQTGQFLFRRYGGIIVCAGRFIAILRVFVALLAGASHMPWPRFLIYNAVGGTVWAGGYAYAAYYLGHRIMRISGPVGIAVATGGGIMMVCTIIFLRRHEARLTAQVEAEARKAMHQSREQADT
ncbi:DedA family protein [Komagataeibacter sp. FXV3]|uniref:DedA family protein n=1 Tax=Komagataeibacter sp. FXV3 TaxID=2608998 RepID=UPI00187B2653|nr:DedA family protein [Komagataeibacter sp. FXV3]MBE7730362.1 DedA family protein [Komagataeibacter sp. FXV3]